MKSLLSSTKKKSETNKLDDSLSSSSSVQLYTWGFQAPLHQVKTDHVENENDPLVAISCGATHALALTNDCELFGCGDNSDGQLQPDGEEDVKNLPVLTKLNLSFLMNSATKVVQVSCGRNFSAVLTNSGRVYTFGDNTFGQLAHSQDRSPKKVPPRMVEGDSIVHEICVFVTCGEYSTYILTKQGKIYSSGCNEYGQLGLGSNEFVKANPNMKNRNSFEMVEVCGALTGNPVVQFSAGKDFCLATTITGKVYAWGRNDNNQLSLNLRQNDENVKFVSEPKGVSLGMDCIFTACGATFSLFLSKSRDVILISDFFQEARTIYDASKARKDLVLEMNCGDDFALILFDSGKLSVFTQNAKVLTDFGLNLTEITQNNESSFKKFIVNQIDNVFSISAGGESGMFLRSEASLSLINGKKKRFTILKDLYPIGVDARKFDKLNSKDFARLLPRLRNVLFDMNMLNASFIEEGSLNLKEFNFESKKEYSFFTSSLDIDGMMSSMKLFLKYTNGSTDKLKLRSLFSSLVAQLDKTAFLVTEPDQLRAYFMLLLSPALLEIAPREHEILVCSIFKLPPVARRMLFSWIYNDIILKERTEFNMSNGFANNIRFFVNILVEPAISHLDQHIKHKKYTSQAVFLCKFLFCLNALVKNRDEVSSTDFYTKEPSKFDMRTLQEMYSKWKAVVNKNIVQQQEDDLNSLARRVGGFGIFGHLFGFPHLVDDEGPTYNENILNGTESGIRRMDSTPSVQSQDSHKESLRNKFAGPTFGLEEFGPQLLLLLSVSPEDDISEADTLLKTSPEFVLFQYPFLLSADTKRRFMQIDEYESYAYSARAAFFRGQTQSFELTVKRSDLLNDTIEKLIQELKKKRPDLLRRPLRIKFEGEEGLDAGGVKKEFFLLLSQDLFNPIYPLFREISQMHLLWFSNYLEGLGDAENVSYKQYMNAVTNYSNVELDTYQAIGVLIGLAVYNDTLLDVQFPIAMYNLLLDFNNFVKKYLTLDEYKKFDPNNAKQLEYIKNITTEDDIDALSLTFEITEEIFGVYKNIELRPNGSKMNVTLDNKQQYIDDYIRYAMFSPLIEKKARQLIRGFNMIIPAEQAAFRLFNPDELELLLCGTRELDFATLEQNCEYEGGYDANSKSVKRFWKILKDFNFEQKQLFLKFCTGSSRAPVGGLKNIRFKIQRAGPDSNQLPTSHTCFNTFMLPDYADETKMRRLLLLAIENSEGFGLQ